MFTPSFFISSFFVFKLDLICKFSNRLFLTETFSYPYGTQKWRLSVALILTFVLIHCIHKTINFCSQMRLNTRTINNCPKGQKHISLIIRNERSWNKLEQSWQPLFCWLLKYISEVVIIIETYQDINGLFSIFHAYLCIVNMVPYAALRCITHYLHPLRFHSLH